MIIRSRDCLRGEPSRRLLESCLAEFMADRGRLDRLFDSYNGRSGILDRTRPEGMPNNRLVHPFPRAITAVSSGYLLGKPVRYAADGDLSRLLSAFEAADIDAVDGELARNAAVCGRGVELIWSDDNAEPRSAAVDPRRAFVVYDDTVAARPLMGMLVEPIADETGKRTAARLRVLTASAEYVYPCSPMGAVGKKLSETNHFFGAVPLIEYWNDESERGDFEPVLSLIEAYDRLQSDRMNDKQQFVDALLLLSGCTMETDERGRSPGAQLREDKVLVLPDAEASASWLCKQLNEADTEVLKNAIAADIHRLSMIPDLTDESFAGNASGVALRYKLMGLEQLTRIKEKWFREGLRQRLRAYAAFLKLRGIPVPDPDAVRIIFTHALPVEEDDRKENTP